jgi:hypothetical protein
LTSFSSIFAMAEAPLPLTRHVMRAAVHVAAILGDQDAPVVVARESYWRRATGGLFSPADLQRGEDALVDAGYLLRNDGLLSRTAKLAELSDAAEEIAIEILAASLFGPETFGGEIADVEIAVADLVEDPARREALLLALARRFDDSVRREVGAIGEEIVVAHARAELSSLGYPGLARKVRRVSLVSDQLGYDVAAPRLIGADRLLEVKATTPSRGELFLSRNEAEVGMRLEDWALIVCQVDDIERRTGSLLGWCQGTLLSPFLPVDAPGGSWQSVSIELERLPLQPGLPRATV